MGMPTDIGVIDCMIGFPAEDVKSRYDFMRPAFRDKDSQEEFTFPVEYIFKQVPKALEYGGDPITVTLTGMDTFGIEQGLISVQDETGKLAAPFCPRIINSPFLAGTEPGDSCEPHRF